MISSAVSRARSKAFVPPVSIAPHQLAEFQEPSLRGTDDLLALCLSCLHIHPPTSPHFLPFLLHPHCFRGAARSLVEDRERSSVLCRSGTREEVEIHRSLNRFHEHLTRTHHRLSCSRHCLHAALPSLPPNSFEGGRRSEDVEEAEASKMSLGDQPSPTLPSLPWAPKAPSEMSLGRLGRVLRRGSKSPFILFRSFKAFKGSEVIDFTRE